MGATGATGASGATGAAGAAGVPGPAGSSVLSGNGAPAATLGNVGDFYIDLTAVQLYGPKTISGWGNGVALTGAAGATGASGTNGTPGSKIYSGSGGPSNTLGNTGDYYIDTTDDLLYGPKTSIWTSTDPVSLRGPAGPDSVIYYNWTGFNAANWSKALVSIDLATSTNYFLTYTISVGALTNNVASRGTVLVYMTSSQYIPAFSSFGGDFQLPASFINPSYLAGTTTQVNEADRLGYSFVDGSITFQLEDQDPTTGYPVTLGTVKNDLVTYGYFYRVIIIPGALQGDEDPKKMSYSQVCSKYGIQP